MEITQQMSKYQREIERFFEEKKEKKKRCLKTLIIDLQHNFWFICGTDLGSFDVGEEI